MEMNPKNFTTNKTPVPALKSLDRSPSFERIEEVLPADKYPTWYLSCRGTLSLTRFLCKLLWTFILIFALSIIFIIFMYVVRNWDFCPLFMVFGFVVGREDRIKRKLEAWSKLVEEFNRKLDVVRAKGTWLCPRCFSEKVIKKDSPRPERGDLGRLECKDCGHKFRREELPIGVEAPARIVNHIVRLVVLGIPVQDIASVVSETANDFGFNYEVKRSTIYGIIREVVEPIKWLDRFISVGLLEGILCYRLEYDEIFQRRAYLHILEEYLESEEGSAKVPRFFYIINAISPENRYPLPPDVAEARNKNAFISFFLKIGPYLGDDPIITSCDELKPLMSSSELRFPASELDTTKRKGAGKMMMEKTAHVERLNRQYRKALPKRKKVGSRMVALNKAELCRLSICYCSTNKRVVEALGIPWPNITRISELILFAKFVQKNAKDVLGDELEVFENPIVGRCVFTINLDQESYPKIKKKTSSTWIIIGLNSWIPYNERSSIVKRLLSRGIIARNEDSSAWPKIMVLIPPELTYNLFLVNVIYDNERRRIHFVGDLLAGPYQILIPLLDDHERGLLAFKIWVDAGKVNHYVFSLTGEEMRRQKAINRRLIDDLLRGEKTEKKVLRSVYFAKRCRIVEEEISCPKEIKVSDICSENFYISRIFNEIKLMNDVAKCFNATHLVSLAFWFANEVSRKRRPDRVIGGYLFIEEARKLLLATLYKVLERIIGVRPSEYAKVLKSFGIEFKEIEEHVKMVETYMPKTFKSLCARLLHPKNPLDDILLLTLLLLLDPTSTQHPLIQQIPMEFYRQEPDAA